MEQRRVQSAWHRRVRQRRHARKGLPRKRETAGDQPQRRARALRDDFRVYLHRAGRSGRLVLLDRDKVLDRQNWTPPQIITNSLNTVFNPCMGASAGGTQFDGWYPSSVSANAAQGHTLRTGQIYFLNGCDGGSMRAFDYRNFTITGGFATHDFNGDGASDILWRNSNGNLGHMADERRGPFCRPLRFGNVPALWSVVAQRDFTGNGDADILWRDTAGNIGMWLMNGSQIASSTILGNVPANWSVAGSGDFNNDLKRPTFSGATPPAMSASGS